MPELETLELKLKADSQKASNEIDVLIRRLDALSTSLGSINTSAITGLSNGVKSLSTAMMSMKNIRANEFTAIAKGIQKIANVDTQKINNTASSFQVLSRSLANMSNISSNVDAITQFASATSKLGGVSIARAINNIPQLAQGLEKLSKGLNMGTVSADFSKLIESIPKLGYKSSEKAITNLPLLTKGLKDLVNTLATTRRVDKNLISLIDSLTKFTSAGSKMGKTANSITKSLNNMTNSSNRAKSSSKGLASAIGKLYATYWLLFRAVGQLKSAMNISSDLTEVENVVRHTFGEYESLIQDFSKTSIQDFGISQLTAKQIASRFQAMGVAMGYTQKEMSEMSLELTKLTADMSSFYNEEQSEVARRMQSIFTGETEPLRRYGLDLTEATLREYAMKKGIDAKISSMTKAQKTMLCYKYVIENTSAAQGDFARTSHNWANQVRMLKQNFQQLGIVVGGSLINAFKPFVGALNVAMIKAVEFATTVSNALGAIFGWKYEISGGGIADDWSDAAISADDIADSTNDASKNVDKMVKSLRAFDELNVIKTTEDNGSGGNGGLGNLNGSAMQGAQGNLVQVDTIFKNYESSIKNLEQLGRHISTALSESMEKINWQNVYKKARNFGKGLADYLNGLINPRLFGNLGKTIANSLNTALESLNTFAMTFEFKTFGVSVATAINEVFRKFNFKLLARTISNWVKGLQQTIVGFLDTVDWELIPQRIVEFITNVDWIGILQGFGEVFWSAIGAVLELTYGTLNAISFGKLGEKLGVKDFEELTTVVQKKTQPTFEYFANNVLPPLQNGFSNLVSIVTPFTSFLKDTLHIAITKYVSPAFDYLRKTVIPNLTEVLKNLWEKVLIPIGSVLNTIVTPAVEFLSDGFSTLRDSAIRPLVDLVGRDFRSAFEGISSLFNGVVAPAIDVVCKGLNFLLGKVLIPIQTFIGGIFFDTIGETVSSVVKAANGIRDAFQGVLGFFKGVFTFDWNAIWNGIKATFIGIWTGISGSIGVVMNPIISVFESFANKIVDAWNWIKKCINSLSVEIPDWVPEIGGEEFGFSLSMTKHIDIPRFEVGGFPQRASLFYAGENGVPELMGTVGGKTAVAGGAEITGIKDAVYNTASEEISLLRQQNELLQGILNKNFGISSDDVGESARRYARDYYNRTGKEAYSF